ncbi:hypothetical protein DF185_21690 [Marinifilum breve]|uniref:DUF5017 domain-containing protein n=2 Tax=Marinifilum breve TaxID=2184082 RepID=A0A2V3ZVD7_9BACT|nr:hypothetical protein DF185_21690 [Marinifilum breve]
MGCAVALLSACDPNDEFIDTLNEEAKAAGIDMPETLTLEEDDYSIVEKTDMFASKEEAATLIPQILTEKYAANASNDGNLINVFYTLDGTALFADLYSEDDEYELQDEDYTVEFGQKYANFSSKSKMDTYVSVFLKDKFKYSQEEGDEVVIKYTLRTAVDKYQEYQFDGTVWTKTDKTNAGFDVENAYELASEDYDSMGDGPGKYDNFSSYDDPEDYLPDFLVAKYPEAVADDIVTVKYKYYGNNEDKVVYLFDGTDWSLKGSVYYDWNAGDYAVTDISVESDDKFVFKAKTGWEIIVITTYEFADADYELTGDEKYKNFGYYDDKAGTYQDVEVENVLQAKINHVLSTRFPDAEEGALFEVTYKFYSSGATNSVKKRYQKEGDKFVLVVE